MDADCCNLKKQMKIDALNHQISLICPKCSLILFLYNIIVTRNAAYVQNKLSFQYINIPNGASRKIPNSLFRLNDPAFPDYWAQKQSHVRAMCSEFGDPDLMLTFTFVNDWPEVKNIENNIKEKGFEKNSIDIRFRPYEEMGIWHSRFYDIYEKGFSILTSQMGFGNVAHYCWRLEFQARGAPHVHALIWLQERVSIDSLQNKFFAHSPNPELKKISNLVNTAMVHNCRVQRCKKSNPEGNCKYGFPKLPCNEVFIDEN